MSRTFSVFIPVYNGGEYLKRCVDSILAQSYSDLELIILESCSNDGSFEWLQTIADPRVTVCQSTGRLSIEENWSRILSHPKGEFMTIVGQDDLLGPEFLEEIHRLIVEAPHASLFLTHFDIIDAKGSRSSFCRPMPKVEYSHEFFAQIFLNLRDSSATGYVMRSKDYEEVGGIPLYHHLLFADNALWYLLTKKSVKMTSPEVGFSYRSHGENTSTKLACGDIVRSFQPFAAFLKTEMSQDKLLCKVVERYFEQYLKNWLEIEVYLSRHLSGGKAEEMWKSVRTLFADFSLPCPFEKKSERGLVFQKITSFARFWLPRGIYEMLRPGLGSTFDK